MHTNILECMGNTPLVKLRRLTADLSGEILLKLEYFSPGHSKKDRVALAIVEDAERGGKINKGCSIVEVTSGTLVSPLCWCARLREIVFIAEMSKGNSIERARMMGAFGGEVILVDQSPESRPGCASKEDLRLGKMEAARISEERNALFGRPVNNPAKRMAHELQTADEILKQTGVESTHFLIS